MFSLNVFRKILLVFCAVAIPINLASIWLGASVKNDEKWILTLIFCIAMPLFVFAFYKTVSYFVNKKM
ncbi:hypothetical protein ACFQPF_17650 [Fictibacillus iocasae]|uniref:Acyl-phosphate glycerol 3-phosphate acyltransferase n=1 Tax=Fictibacillus iocasae TaxID=2715437 RepID=A0ABW2NVR8_9BACL